MFYLRDLEACRVALSGQTLPLASVLKVAPSVGGLEPAGLVDRLVETGQAAADLVAEDWPRLPIDERLLLLGLAVEGGAVSIRTAIQILASGVRRGMKRIRPLIVRNSELGPAEVDALADQAGAIARDFETIVRSEPEAIADPFLRMLNLGLDAGLFGGEAVLELLRWHRLQADRTKVRSYLEHREGVQSAQAEQLVSRFFGGGPAGGGANGEAGVGSTAGTRVQPGDRTVASRPEPGDGRASAPVERTVALSSEPVAPRLRRIGGYQILGELGRGGMGVVFKARQADLDRLVALKVLTLGEGADPEWVERFLREARAAGRLRHPNIVGVLDYGSDGDQHYFTMELIDGLSLAEKIHMRRIDAEGLARVGAAIARALHAAHDADIVHRDVKPSNILIDCQGTAYLTDFGLAVDQSGTTMRLTKTGATLGTPPYMPPEQVQAGLGDVDARSDIYSLGASIYEGLTGRLPFEGSSVYEIIQKVTRDEPQPIARLNPAAPRDLVRVVEKAMDKEKSRRYASALELALDLERYLADEPVLARPIGRPERIRRWVGRRKALSTAIALAGVVAAILLVLASAPVVRYLDYRRQMAAGEEALEAGDHRSAQAAFLAALALREGDESARKGFLDAGHLEEQALKDLALEVQSDPEDEELFRSFLSGADDYLRRYEDEDFKVLRDRIQTQREFAKKVLIGRLITQAVARMRAADQAAPGSPDHEYASAIDRFGKAIEADPGLPALRLLLVYAHLREADRIGGGAGIDQRLRAVAALGPAIDAAGANWALRFLRASIHLLIDRPPEPGGHDSDLESALVDLTAAFRILWQQHRLQEDLGYPVTSRSVRTGDPGRYLVLVFESLLLEMANVSRQSDGEPGLPDWVDEDTLLYLARMSEDLIERIQDAFSDRFDFFGAGDNVVALGAQAGNLLRGTNGSTLGAFLTAITPFYALLGEPEVGRMILTTLPGILPSIRVEPADRLVALGRLEMAIGREVGPARRSMDEAIEVAPGNLGVVAALVEFHLWARRIDSGPEDHLLAAEELIEGWRGPPADVLRCLGGVVAYHRGSFEEALGELEEVGGADSFALVYRALCLERVGRKAEAQGAWQTASGLDPSIAVLETWLHRRRLRIHFSGRFHEVARLEPARRQIVYAGEVSDLSEQAARLLPILYYDLHDSPRIACLAAIRLCDISVRLGRPRDLRLFKNLIDAGFDGEATLSTFRPHLVRYLEGWTDEEMTQILDARTRNSDLAYYWLGLASEVVHTERTGHLDRAREHYREALRAANQEDRLARRWAEDALRRLGG